MKIMLQRIQGQGGKYKILDFNFQGVYSKGDIASTVDIDECLMRGVQVLIIP